MNPTLSSITRLHNVIDRSLFLISGTLDYDRVTDAFITLGNAVNDFDGDTDDIWYIGEFGHACLSDLIIGAYWHFSEWHAGQSSKSYAALCSLGQVFSPGMSSPEEDDFTFEMLNQLAGEAS